MDHIKQLVDRIIYFFVCRHSTARWNPKMTIIAGALDLTLVLVIVFWGPSHLWIRVILGLVPAIGFLMALTALIHNFSERKRMIDEELDLDLE